MLQKILSILGIITVVISYIVGPSLLFGKILSIIALVAVVYPLVKSIKTSNYHISIFYVFVISYILVPFNYFWLNKSILSYNPCERLSNVYLVLQIISTFHFILLYKINFSKSKNTRKPFVENNTAAFWFLVFFSLILVLFFAPEHTILNSGGYGEAHSLNEGSTLFTYSIMPISLALVFANDSFKRKVVYMLVLVFCIRNLLTGGRVESVMLLLIIFLLRIQYIWTVKKMALAILIGGSFFLVWGMFRSDVDQDLIGLYANMIASIFSDNVVDFQSGTSANVYYSSVRVIYLIEEGILSWDLRLSSLSYFFMSVFVPYSALPAHANLSLFMQNEYWSGGGGFGPVFFYGFCGWIGVVLFSLFVSNCINKYNTTKNKYVLYYLILLIATTPRWYAYYPIQIIKFCVIGMILYYIVDMINTRKYGRIK